MASVNSSNFALSESLRGRALLFRLVRSMSISWSLDAIVTVRLRLRLWAVKSSLSLVGTENPGIGKQKPG
jgi:hypothetical protein